MRRGEIWWAEVSPHTGRRPVVLLSRNEAYIARSLVIVAPITTRIRNIPSEVILGIDNGMPRECAVNLESVTPIPKSCLREHLTILSPERLQNIENAIHFALGLE